MGLVVILLLGAGTVYSIKLGDTLRFLPDESDYTALLLILFLLRWLLIKWFRPSPYELLLGGLYLLGGAIQALFFTRIRFRLPLDYLVILTGALFLASLWKQYSDKEQLMHNINIQERAV